MEYMTVAEVAGELRVDESTVRRQIRSGQLPATRIGRQYRISRVEYHAYKARLEVKREGEQNTGLALAH